MQIADGGGGGGPLDASMVKSIGVAFDGFAGGAKAGKIAINETGGDALLAAIHNMMEWVDGNMGDLNMLAQEPRLGGSNGANTMKPYVVNVATDDQGFMPMLKKFRESLDKAEQGILDAMNNYKTMDVDGAGRLT
jgi:hypothetical protein